MINADRCNKIKFSTIKIAFCVQTSHQKIGFSSEKKSDRIFFSAWVNLAGTATKTNKIEQKKKKRNSNLTLEDRNKIKIPKRFVFKNEIVIYEYEFNDSMVKFLEFKKYKWNKQTEHWLTDTQDCVWK